jgi:ABC-type dipeptide/oligopeptide/nickel transport system permease subunit
MPERVLRGELAGSDLEVAIPPSGAAVGRRAAPRRRLLAVRIPLGPLIALIVLLLFVLAATFASMIAPHDPQQSFIGAVLHAPSSRFPMGTDDLGRDVLSRVLYGAQVSLRVGILTTLGALAAGVVLALVATMGPALAGAVVMRTVDVFIAFPSLLLALAIVATLGPGLTHALLAVAVSLVPGYVRTVRSLILGVRSREYVVAARAMGASPIQLAVRHILPNIGGGLLVLATLGTALVTLEVSALSFLGLGAQPPQAEWGSMLATAQAYLQTAWWMAVFPAAAITITILSINVVGDWLRDVFDPRSRRAAAD